MRRNFTELEAKMTPAQLAASDKRVKQMVAEMPLNRLRAARKLTQEHLANVLQRDQSAISQLERRSDMYVSTLADFIRAMGGELEIRANFPDGSVRIAGLAESAKL
jgi:hypothetical protein